MRRGIRALAALQTLHRKMYGTWNVGFGYKLFVNR